ncbi:RBBP9/YdeN family alpha/beta hydrolase [Tenacibaculum sp.]|uniref:RBBP9/YdeN family alpha/beta hydrolase n=1 Tax=Tenacibaculum sp. TaxID=1906242 RepID=UPI003D0C736C
MKKHKIYLIHGYTASPDSNWFQDLKNNLENEFINVSILNMPDSQNPKLNGWINHMENHIKDIDEHTIFIGHSLGCVSILNFLNQFKATKIKGLFLISGFVESSPIPELIEFVKPKLNYNHLKEITKTRVAISAIDDDIIPFEYSKIMAEKLDAKFTLLEEGKHFIDRDNFTKFPFLVKEITECIREFE